MAPYLAGAGATVAVVLALGALIGVGGPNPGPRAQNPFVLPTKHERSTHPRVVAPSVVPSATTSLTPVPTTAPPTPSPSPTASPTPSPTAAAT